MFGRSLAKASSDLKTAVNSGAHQGVAQVRLESRKRDISPTVATTKKRRYTKGMKTAVSLPDAVFRAADRQAKRSQKSRSQLYAEALAEYLSRHAPDEVTDAMNRVVDQLDEPRDPFVLAAAQSVLERTEW
jgi:hypothetical protein